MKKNVMMRVASIMLVLVLMSSSVISGTFAKYVTNGASTDTARVAKFGVTVTGANDMFNRWYTTHDPALTPEEQLVVGANSVVSSNAENVVAPGTNGSLAKFTVTGTPEVAVRVNYAITDINVTGWEVEGDEYFPIIFTIEGTDYFIGATESIAEFIARLETAVAGCTAVYAAGTNLEGKAGTELDVSWRWDFEGHAVGAKLNGYQTDAKDTILGNWDLLHNAKPEMTVTITCTVTQID